MDVRFTKSAVQDIHAVRVYTRAHVGNQQELEALSELKRALRQITTFPQSGFHLAKQDVRVLSVPATPFQLAYRVKGAAIEVVACFHSARQWPE